MQRAGGDVLDPWVAGAEFQRKKHCGCVYMAKHTQSIWNWKDEESV